jgi:hypothetical protein
MQRYGKMLFNTNTKYSSRERLSNSPSIQLGGFFPGPDGAENQFSPDGQFGVVEYYQVLEFSNRVVLSPVALKRLSKVLFAHGHSMPWGDKIPASLKVEVLSLEED